MVEYATNPNTILKQSGMTLNERSIMLHRKFPYTRITGNYLGKIYSKHIIKMKKVVMKKFENFKIKMRIQKKILECKNELIQAIEEGVNVYYLDECMFTSKTYQLRDWSPRRMNVTFGQNYFNMKVTAFLGVIAKDKGIFHYRLFDKSVDTEKFMKFLKRLKKKHG